jgi:hypothetical protein
MHHAATLGARTRLLADVAPAALLGLFATVTVAVAQPFPFGDATLLVRVSDAAPAAALAAAASVDGAFISIPQPGLVVLRADASRVRSVLGFALPWKGSAPCSPPP